MVITQIEALDKTRQWIHMDGEESFWLYRKDIAEFGLKQHQILTEQQYQFLRNDKVLLYAKKKTLELLERQDRSEAELKAKLAQRDFSESIISEAIAYAKKFHYVDDVRFAFHFIQSRIGSKSKKQICFLLYQKGVSKEHVEEAYEQFMSLHEQPQESELIQNSDNIPKDPEVLAIEKIVKRKGKSISEYSKEDLLKLTSSLYRKGFRTDSIRKVLSYDLDMD